MSIGLFCNLNRSLLTRAHTVNEHGMVHRAKQTDHSTTVHACIYIWMHIYIIYTYVCMYTHTQTHTERERERERDCIYIHGTPSILVSTTCVRACVRACVRTQQCTSHPLLRADLRHADLNRPLLPSKWFLLPSKSVSLDTCAYLRHASPNTHHPHSLPYAPPPT